MYRFTPPGRSPNDPWLYRIVVCSLAATIITCAVGAILIQVRGQSSSELLSSLGTGALAALAGLLVPSPIK